MSDGLKYNLKFYLAWVLDEVCPKKDLLFIIVDWSAKVGSQEIPGIKALGYKMKQDTG